MAELYFQAIVITLGVTTALAMLLLVFGGLVLLLTEEQEQSKVVQGDGGVNGKASKN